MRKNPSFFLLILLLGGLFLCSCEVAVFDTLPPVKKELHAFPPSFEGEWENTAANASFYVTRLSFNDDTVFYEMGSIAPGVMSPLVLEKDSMELHVQKNTYFFSLAGNGYWLHYIIKQPNSNELIVYGFGEETKKHVKLYEADNSEEGFMFTVFHPTTKEWKQLLKSSALVELQRYHRKE